MAGVPLVRWVPTSASAKMLVVAPCIRSRRRVTTQCWRSAVAVPINPVPLRSGPTFGLGTPEGRSSQLSIPRWDPDPANDKRATGRAARSGMGSCPFPALTP